MSLIGADHHGARRKSRLGFYMYAPRLGGAEAYLRDLLWGIDRDRYDVTLVAPEWEAFDRFLDLTHSPPVNRVNLAILEPGARRAPGPPVVMHDQLAPGYGEEATPSRMRRLAKHVPLGYRAAPVAQWTLRQLYWQPDLRSLTRAFESSELDILHSVNGGHPGATSARAALPAAQRAGIPGRVLTVCSTAMARSGVTPIERFLDGRVSDAACAVIVPAQRPFDALVERRGFRPAQIEIVPWGVKAPVPPRDREAASMSARLELGLPLHRPIVGTLGNFTPTKGHAVFVAALPYLKRIFPDLVGVLAGEGPRRAEVERQALALQLGESIRFLGSVPDAFTLLRALDVFVLASEVEGLPLVVLEAMSQGIPVVSTDVGGVPEAVRPGYTGYLVEPGNPVVVAEAVARILADPVEAATMGGAARASFDRRFSLPVMLRAHEDLYERVVLGDRR